MRGYLTPNVQPIARIYRLYAIPDDVLTIAAFDGAIYSLTQAHNWQAFGEITPDEIAYDMLTVYENYRDYSMLGTIVPIALETMPDHMLLCDGSTYSSADYPELYAAIAQELKNTIAGTFSVPDLRDRFVLGASTGAQSYSTGGSATVTLTESQIPAHTHTTNPHTHTFTNPTLNVDVESVGVPDPTGVGLPMLPDVTGSATVTVNSTGGGEPHSNMPPYYALQYGIICR